MKNMRTFAVLVLVVVATAATFCLAQSSGMESAREHTFWPQEPPVAPVYPPLARQARIMGDVKIRIVIRQDGSVSSADVVSGPPMLQRAALESAQKSKFRCQPDCTNDVTTFVFTYTFGLRGGPCCCETVRPRSAKCVYLWKCGPWQTVARPAPTVGVSVDRVIVLADATCVQTNSTDGAESQH